jgi:hypothetical protein
MGLGEQTALPCDVALAPILTAATSTAGCDGVVGEVELTHFSDFA